MEVRYSQLRTRMLSKRIYRSFLWTADDMVVCLTQSYQVYQSHTWPNLSGSSVFLSLKQFQVQVIGYCKVWLDQGILTPSTTDSDIFHHYFNSFALFSCSGILLWFDEFVGGKSS